MVEYESFAYYLQPNETVYKGSDRPIFNVLYTEPTWLCVHPDTTKEYGPYLHEVSVFHGEKFHDEICLFNPSKCNIIVKKTSNHNLTPSSTRTGGNQISSHGQYISEEPIDMNAIKIKIMRLVGYTGKIEYDENNMVIDRDYKWITEWRNEQNRMKQERLMKRMLSPSPKV